MRRFRSIGAREWRRAAPGLGRAGRPRSRGGSSLTRVPEGGARRVALPMRQSRRAWCPLVDHSFFRWFQTGRKAGRSLWCKVSFSATVLILVARFIPTIRGGFP